MRRPVGQMHTAVGEVAYSLDLGRRMRPVAKNAGLDWAQATLPGERNTHNLVLGRVMRVETAYRLGHI